MNGAADGSRPAPDQAPNNIVPGGAWINRAFRPTSRGKKCPPGFPSPATEAVRSCRCNAPGGRAATGAPRRPPLPRTSKRAARSVTRLKRSTGGAISGRQPEPFARRPPLPGTCSQNEDAIGQRRLADGVPATRRAAASASSTGSITAAAGNGARPARAVTQVRRHRPVGCAGEQRCAFCMVRRTTRSPRHRGGNRRCRIGTVSDQLSRRTRWPCQTGLLMAGKPHSNSRPGTWSQATALFACRWRGTDSNGQHQAKPPPGRT